jgi:oligoendopeptidase F
MTDSKKRSDTLGTSAVLWNLQDLYAAIDDSAVERDTSWCQQEADAISKEYSGRVAQLGAEPLFDLISRLEALDCRLSKLATYSFLTFTTQLDNAQAGAFDQQIRELVSSCGTSTIFFELEWNSAPQKSVQTLLKDQKLAHYRHYLETLRRYRPHQLSEVEEKLLLEKEVTGRRSWTTLFNKVLSAYRFGDNGRTEEEVLTDLYSPDREVRKTAADELTKGLKENSHILSHIFNTLAADKMVADRLRHYPTWISSMNLGNQLQDSTVETLVEAVTSRYDIVRRYYTIKRDQLGLHQLEDYDRYAPLPSLPATRITWQSCKETVLSSFAAFSPRMAEIAEEFFTKKWIHAPIMQGKRGGAFAHPCVPEVHPYVLVNYTGNLRDVSTVAHELGHGIHQMLASERGHYNSNTPLPLAETASVFAELLVFNSQLDLLDDDRQRAAFISQKLESIFATVFRQTAMNRFEDLMHRGRREQGELSTKQLSKYWLSSQRAMFADSVHLREDYGIWWSYIPHFLSTPGYVYSYAFGELLVLALYKIYQREGQGFVQQYLQLLSAGGSSSPYQLMQPFGIDLNSREFWLDGLTVIDQLLARIEPTTA